MKKIIYIGFKYMYGDKKMDESVEIRFFIDSINNVHGYSAEGLFIDNYLNKKRDSYILNEISKKSPDLIFTNIINDEISDTVLTKLSKKYNTVNWFGDDQWRFERFSKQKSKLFNYCVTTDKASLKKYKKEGIENVIYSQWAATKINKKINKNNYLFDISFVGSYSPARDWIISRLKSKKIQVKSFGSGWNSTKKISYDQMLDVFLNSKINLNLSNSVPKNYDFLLFSFQSLINSFFNVFHIGLKQLFYDVIKFLKNVKFFFFYEKNQEQIKARNFEIPAAGGFQITSFVKNLSDYFVEDEEIVQFKTIDELIVKCKYFLNNDIEREKIRLKSNTAVKSQTYSVRMKETLDVIFKNK